MQISGTRTGAEKRPRTARAPRPGSVARSRVPRGQRAQSLAELALILPVFLILTLAYFAVSDWLYVVKLAAYARIIADDQDAGRQAAAVAPQSAGELENVRM